MKNFKKIIIVLVIIGLIAGGFYAFSIFKGTTHNSSDVSSANIDISYLTKEIKRIGELRTAKITYGCLSEFEKGNYPILTKTAFSMYYEATAEAGIDIEKIDISQDFDGKFIIKLPEPTLYEAKIDMSSIKIFKKSKAIFNWSKPEDLQEALKIAERDVLKKAQTDQILEIANDKAVSVLENVFSLILEKNQFEIIPFEKTS